MKLNTATIQFIENTVSTARSVGIEDIIIEEDVIRAADEAKTVLVYHTNNIPDLPFKSIGLSRIGVFLSRVGVVKGQKDFAVDATTHDDEGYVKNLLISAKGVKIDFRCADPKRIIAPKVVNDTMKCLVPLNADAVVLLQKAAAAVSSDNVTIIGNKDGVTFELYENETNDKFTHTYQADIEKLGGDDIQFVHSYPLKIVLPLFKENVDSNFAIGEKGMLNIQMNGLDLYVLPQVN